jgi:hypothetical protein
MNKVVGHIWEDDRHFRTQSFIDLASDYFLYDLIGTKDDFLYTVKEFYVQLDTIISH